MNQKQIGVILIIIGIFLSAFVYYVKVQDEQQINLIVEQSGSCFLKDGTCLHNRLQYVTIFGWIFSAALIILGLYLVFFDKTQKVLAEHQVKVASALQEAKKKDEFSAFLSGFTPDEQAILKAIKEQDGIQQSTLRYRTGISKASLSLMLKSLEGKGIISRKEKGKTNEVYLRKKF